MSAATKRLLAFGILAVGVVAIALVVQQLVVIVVSAAVAAVVAILVHRSLGGAPTEEAVPAAGPADAWIGHLQSLVALNIDIRENGLPSDVIAKLEEAIDVLRRVVPELNADHAGSELTWTVNRMAVDYLPRIVTPYVKLGPPAREEHREELLRSLEGLESELENIADLLRGAKVGEFKTKAAFLRARFLDPDLG